MRLMILVLCLLLSGCVRRSLVYTEGDLSLDMSEFAVGAGDHLSQTMYKAHVLPDGSWELEIGEEKQETMRANAPLFMDLLKVGSGFVAGLFTGD